MYPVIGLPFADGAVQSKSTEFVADDVIARSVIAEGISAAVSLAIFDGSPVPCEFIALTR